MNERIPPYLNIWRVIDPAERQNRQSVDIEAHLLGQGWKFW